MFMHGNWWTSAARRTLAALGLVSALTFPLLGPEAPAGLAAPAQAPEPSARLQVIIKSITIHDDRDSVLRGVGEMLLFMQVWRCNEGVALPCDPSEDGGFVVVAKDDFQATSGQTLTPNRPLPQSGDTMYGGNTSEKLGFAVYDGPKYVLLIDMVENDGLIPPRFDQMGKFFHTIDTAEHGLGIGVHTKRPFKEEQYQWGDYTITYEIRRTPLPDLRPVSIKVHDLPGRAEKRVCAAIQNVENGQAGAFEVAFRINDVVPTGGRIAALAPSPGNHVDVCAEIVLPASGKYTLAAAVDEPRVLIEFNEANNVYETQYEAPTSASAQTTPAPNAALPDLLVSAIKVNGQAPDGKDDCKNGKNEVVVTVKNQGTTTAVELSVRLMVDDDAGGALQQNLDKLEAGKEATIKFGGVTMRKGAHTLTATADPTSSVAESNEANNTRMATASCKDD